jgi:hypothetical protein
VGAQDRQDESFELASVALRLEMPLLNELGAEACGRCRVLERTVGMRRGQPGGLRHRRVEQRA